MKWFAAFVAIGFSGVVYLLAASDEKIRVAIASEMSVEQLDAFYALLEAQNPSVDGSFRPGNSSETDLLVYLLDNWGAASDAPGSTEFPLVFANLAKAVASASATENPIVLYSLFADFSDGHSIRFIFYSLRDAGYPPLRCVAHHLALEAGRGPQEDFKNRELVDCRTTKGPLRIHSSKDWS